MLIADSLDFDFQRIYNQGNAPSCTAYSFFALLEEFVQQSQGISVEFDMDGYFNEMEKKRGRKRRQTWLLEKGRKEGFLTKNGYRIKVLGFVEYQQKDGKWDFSKLRHAMQRFGPLWVSVKTYGSKHLKKDILEMPTEPQSGQHAMAARGFGWLDGSRVFTFRNSWGKSYADVKASEDVMNAICYRIFAFTRVTCEHV